MAGPVNALLISANNIGEPPLTSRNDKALEAMADDVMTTVRPPRRRGLLRWGALLAVTACGATWWLWPAPERTAWETRPVDRGDMVLTATATGNLEPKSEITVGAEISGLIQEVYVAENDSVQQGAVLARFDTEELEVNLREAEARLALAKASVEEARATLAEVTVDLRRKDELRQRGTASQSELDSAVAARDRAAARVTYAHATVNEAEAAVSMARTRLEKAVITSPINGVVLQRSVEPGNTVAANFQTPQLFILAEDLRRMELHVALDEADVGMVEAGQPATFTVDAWPDREFEATVLSVYLYPTVENNVVTYTTVLGVDNAEGLLKPGMTATATIRTGFREQVLRVPNAALRFTPPATDEHRGLLSGPPGMRRDSADTPGNTVWVLRDGQPQRLAIRARFTDGRFTELDGDELAEGEQVIVGMKPVAG